MDYNNFIAVDMGNTTCEFAIFEHSKIVNKFFTPTSPLDLSFLIDESEFKDVLIGNLFVISSVVKRNNEYLKNFLENNLKAKVLLINPVDFKMLTKNSSGNIASIGVDIICKSEWAIKNKKNPCLIIDVGTATVVQYVDEQGYMNKVAITLGLSNLYKTLNSNTDLLPLVSPEKTLEVLGSNTISAMLGGIYWGYIGTINSLLKKSMQETKCNNIFITGGLSPLIVDDLDYSCIHDTEIIFEGIRVILENNIKKIKEI